MKTSQFGRNARVILIDIASTALDNGRTVLIENANGLSVVLSKLEKNMVYKNNPANKQLCGFLRHVLSELKDEVGEERETLED